MSENLRQIIEIVGQDQASATLRNIIATMRAMERQAERTGKAVKASLGADLAEAAAKAAKAVQGDVAAVTELQSALRTAAAEQRSLTAAMRGSQAAGVRAARTATASARNAASGRARAEADDFRAWRQKWRRRQASERADAADLRRQLSAGRYLMGVRQRSERMAQREADRVAKAEAAATTRREKAERVAFDRRLRQARYLMGVRQRSEAAELAHMRTVGRERAAMRRHAISAGRHAYGHARHAVRSLNHPVHESLGFALSAGAAAGGAFAEHVVRASEAFDTSMTRLRMFAPQLDADAIRKTALADSVALGIDASKIVDSIAKSVRDGVPPAIAQTLPKSIVQTAQVMGGDVERLTDSLAEGIQEATSMGWIKDQVDARRFLNLEAGLSTTAGNTSEKTEQFIAAGGLGHGKEMGLDLEKTMAYGAMLNASGSRTGQASARFMGQLSQNVPKIYDKYRQSVESRKNTEEDRAVRSAPRNLGYGSVREMQSRIMAGPEGLIDFATRLQKLDDKARKLVLEGYGFSEQGGAMLAELGSNGGTKGKAVLARARELAEQREANDYLSQKFADWQKSLSFMLQQIEKGWRAIENEIGDVIKSDIIAPLRDWWVILSGAIVNSDLKGHLHAAIAGLVHGLGFDDVRAMLDAMTADVHGFDFAGFMRGVGEGIRETVDAFRSLGSVFGGVGGLSAETVGRIATEFLGLSLALRFVAPVINTLAGIASAFLAIKAAVEGAAVIGRLTGIADGLKGILALDLAGGAAGLASLAGGIMVLLGLAKLATDKGMLQPPKDWSTRGFLNFLDPNLGNLLLGKQGQAPGDGMTGGDFVKGPHGGLMRKQSFDGDAANWRNLLTPASWSPSDSDSVARDAQVSTARGVVEVREAVDRLGASLRFASLSTSAGVAGFGGGGGEGGGNANLRYGRGAAGGYRSTPGTGSYGDPSRSLLDLIAKSEGGGYNVSYGNGKYLPGGQEQNLTGKSLNEILALGKGMIAKSGSSAMGRYMLTGQTIRDLMGRLHLTGNEKYDEAMQDRLASKLISYEGSRALGRWEGLKRGSYMAQAQALLRSGSIASQGGDTTFSGGAAGAGKAVDIAMGMQGAGERSAQQILGAYMHPGEWCADFVNGALQRAGIKGSGSATARSFSTWGHHVGFGEVQKGDVIEENAHGRGVNHVGLATGNVQRDRNGNVTAVEMVSGNYGRMVRKNWERVGIIADLRRSDQAVAAAARKVGETVRPNAKPIAPADIAGRVRSHARPRPSTGDAPTGSMTSADNSTTHHTWHVYGEPARKAVQSALGDHRSGSTIDLDAFA